MAGSRMQVGINRPWQNYGWDFGEAPAGADGRPWGARAAWRAGIAAELAGFKQLGLFAVRWFVLADGLVYGSGAAAPRPDVDEDREGQWRFDEPPPLSPAVIEDVAALCAAVRQAGLLLLPSLIDFRFCYPGLPLPGTGLVKQGRSDVINDPSKRARFFERVLAPLLQATAPYKDAIYAWELINEPEWCTHGSGIGRDWFNENKTVSAAAMQDFLREGLARINAAGFPSTVGLCAATLGRWDTAALGVTRHQIHYYGVSGDLPADRFDPRWPLFLGEIATARHHPWPELSDQSVYERLRLCEGKGYPTTFLWSANETDGTEPRAVDWSPGVQEQVRRFTGGA